MYGDEEESRFFRLETLLAVSCAALLFQLFPSIWWGLLATLDLRNWTWRYYAAASAMAIVVLLALKAWRER
jgi:hypothetical protein